MVTDPSWPWPFIPANPDPPEHGPMIPIPPDDQIEWQQPNAKMPDMRPPSCSACSRTMMRLPQGPGKGDTWVCTCGKP